MEWVEEKLDRVLTNSLCFQNFQEARVWNRGVSSSDHMPIFLTPTHTSYRPCMRKFRFENWWLREQACTDIVANFWRSNNLSYVPYRIFKCGEALRAQNGSPGLAFKSKLQDCERAMAWHNGQQNAEAVRQLNEARNAYFKTLTQRENFWKQRQNWLREGDQNTKFFHSAASARHKKNKSIN